MTRSLAEQLEEGFPEAEDEYAMRMDLLLDLIRIFVAGTYTHTQKSGPSLPPGTWDCTHTHTCPFNSSTEYIHTVEMLQFQCNNSTGTLFTRMSTLTTLH